MYTKNLFRDARQFRLFVLLVMSTLFCFALIGVRLEVLGISLTKVQSTQQLLALKNTTTFLFLVWNLFLAWIPYGIALLLEPASQKFNKKIITGVMVLSWLFFFPNAPYILTDLLHLRGRHPIPHWYDLMLIVSFAWTGLLLGYLSLFEVQTFIQKRKGKFYSWVFSLIAIFLCGLGIYLGRYLRWNSWDILHDPWQIVADALQSMFYPEGQSGTGIIWVSFGFLLLGYLTVVTLMGSFWSSDAPAKAKP